MTVSPSRPESGDDLSVLHLVRCIIVRNLADHSFWAVSQSGFVKRDDLGPDQTFANERALFSKDVKGPLLSVETSGIVP